MSYVDAPCYLKIRQDNDAGVVRAWFALTDGSFEVEVATISLNILQDFPEEFKVWKEMLARINKKGIEKTLGIKVVSSYERKPNESN